MEKGIRLDENFISQVIFRIEFPTIKKLTGNDKGAKNMIYTLIRLMLFTERITPIMIGLKLWQGVTSLVF